MNEPVRLLLKEKSFQRLKGALETGSARASRLTAGAASLVACALHVATSREVLLVVPHMDLAEDLHENASLFVPGSQLLESRDASLSFPEAASQRAASARIRLFERYLPGARRPPIVVASAPALAESTPTPDRLASDTFQISTGMSLDMGRLLQWLDDHAFTRQYESESPWHFAVRGGIVDVFPPGADYPSRVEFFGDEVASIRTIDPATSLSAVEVDSLRILAPLSRPEKTSPAPFTSLLADDTIVLLWEGSDVQAAALAHCERSTHEPTVPWGDLYASLRRFAFVEATAFDFSDSDSVSFDTRAYSSASHEVEDVVEEFTLFARSMQRTFLFALNDAERSRLRELFTPADSSKDKLFTTVVGRFNRSFYFASRGLAFVGHQDVFHRYRQRRRQRHIVPSRPLSSVLELATGDYVVHVDHGIARFRGTRVIRQDSLAKEYLVLEFAKKTRLLVPVTHIDLVSKYIGPSDRAPALSTIGTTTWKARKAGVARAVKELAAELIRLEAVRSSKPGIAFPLDKHAQSEFEAEFIYEETDDQLRALDEIKSGMTSPRPMDRLLCGDVGFGKTELAVRAAFMAVSAGKQVAVLVPTTILAEQHFRTFSERMADYPVLIEVLSRLRSKRDQRDTLQRLRKKQVDIVIGTHRLVQRDVIFADLGLVIIDEEQRFGVAAKERLKRLRETVDVLTLTATPIPRTLHMALTGLRDISVLETPPQERFSVSTFVGTLSKDALREVVMRELAREGQVFFVHNRVHSIDRAAARLQEAVPEAKIAVAHGQMNEHTLARRMLDFVAGRYDCLVATTIIENGLDIPNVNTIIVDQADLFGLADLHQLRGRVGRYKRHAYAYFLLPEGRPLSSEGRKRLQAIEHFSELGAGFRIALRDMEIRGVGNVLGSQQSGHIAAVGYELFSRLLAQAVDSIRGRPTAQAPEAYIDLATSSHLPESYVESPVHRLDLYKRLSTALALEDVDALMAEMTDRFGPLPPAAAEFLSITRLRILAFCAGIRMLLRKKDCVLVQARDVRAAAALLAGPGRSVRITDSDALLVSFDDALPAGCALLELFINLLRHAPSNI